MNGTDHFCAMCDRPATQQQPDDLNAYCDMCVERMMMEDRGVVYCAMQVVTHALATVRDLVAPEDLKRLVEDSLHGVLHEPGHCAVNTYDVCAFSLTPRFQPITKVGA